MMETLVTEIMVAVELEAIFKANCAAGTCGAVDYTLSIFPKACPSNFGMCGSMYTIQICN